MFSSCSRWGWPSSAVSRIVLPRPLVSELRTAASVGCALASARSSSSRASRLIGSFSAFDVWGQALQLLRTGASAGCASASAPARRARHRAASDCSPLWQVRVLTGTARAPRSGALRQRTSSSSRASRCVRSPRSPHRSGSSSGCCSRTAASAGWALANARSSSRGHRASPGQPSALARAQLAAPPRPRGAPWPARATPRAGHRAAPDRPPPWHRSGC